MSQDGTVPKLVPSDTRPKISEKQLVIRRPRSASRESSSTVNDYEPTVTTDAGEYTDITEIIDSYTVNFTMITAEILPTVTTQNSTDSRTANIPTPMSTAIDRDSYYFHATTNNGSKEMANASTVGSCHQEQLGVAVLTPDTDNETGVIRAQRPTQSLLSPPRFEKPSPSAIQLLSANNERMNEMSLCPWNYTVHTDETR